MDLFFRKTGNGHPFIILHGLYGMSDNWYSIGKTLSAYFEVYIPDLRNHGRSPHHNQHTYNAMQEDLCDFMNSHRIEKATIMGHSMGGKVAMNFAFNCPERIRNLIIIDISPRSYLVEDKIPEGTHHDFILNALYKINLSQYKKREEIDIQLSKSIKEKNLRQFLLKNIKRKNDGSYKWALNIAALKDNLRNILDGINPEQMNNLKPIGGFPCLFIKGENSDYINKSDKEMINKLFLYSEIITINNSGHWLHAEKPDELIDKVLKFIF